MAEKKQQFSPGDMVELKCGGAMLVVAEVDAVSALCYSAFTSQPAPYPFVVLKHSTQKPRLQFWGLVLAPAVAQLRDMHEVS